jgi:lipopolysaccharide biosynthesis protein
MLGHLLGSRRQVQAILKHLSECPDVGLLYPANFIPIQYCLETDINQWNVEYLAERIELKSELPWEIVCPVGSMFWARTKAFGNLFDAELSYSEFENEVGQLDGTLAHAFERLFVYIAKDNGFSSCIIGSRLN